MSITAGRGLVWLVGASSGIGSALALRLADAGWTVAVSARRRENLQRLAERAPEGSLLVFPVDVTDAAGVRSVLAEIERTAGPVEMAILNAGDYQPMSLDDFDAGLIRRLMEVNYHGVVHCLDALLPCMRSRGRGRILLTASVAGYRGLPLAAPYGASKAALISMAESLRPEMERAGLTLRVINPGFVDTPLTRKNRFAMPFLLTPEQAAGHIAAQLDRDGFEISFPWRFVWMLKLLRCLPYRLYFMLMRRISGK